MALIDIKLPGKIARALKLPVRNPARSQLKVLRKLLRIARFTQFGQQYLFDKILLSKQPVKSFQQLVPIQDYNTIYKNWWHKTLDGIPDVCWPGKIKYFALSSGTSEAASKYIPITNELIRGNKVVMVNQLLSLRGYSDIPFGNVAKGWLSLGGSTTLQKGKGYYSGDLSGITAKKQPFWFQPFYKPGKKIARQQNWQKKLEEIVEKAPSWDIGFILGVPAWVQLCMEMIIDRYNLNTIHDIWPNLSFFVHGGVAFEPYKKGFERYLAKPLTYINTYLASEGFIAYQHQQGVDSMRLVTNNHIFHEFVEFSEKNFDSDGNIKPDAEALVLHEVEEGKDYALLISTVAGAWRYLIGDTIRFVDKEKCEIIITGRTKFFLSLVGEHLSVDNMNHAIQSAQEYFNISIPEFAVAGTCCGTLFGHRWFVATNDIVNATALETFIDEKLKELNDDYAVERKHALKEMTVEVLTPQLFMNFMNSKGKVGGQHKFPRVLKGKMLDDWTKFLETETSRQSAVNSR
jgi:hypothetical protein